MMTYIEPTLWAQKQFGQADLNDPRRTQRLVALATSLAEQPGCSGTLNLATSSISLTI